MYPEFHMICKYYKYILFYTILRNTYNFRTFTSLHDFFYFTITIKEKLKFYIILYFKKYKYFINFILPTPITDRCIIFHFQTIFEAVDIIRMFNKAIFK